MVSGSGANAVKRMSGWAICRHEGFEFGAPVVATVRFPHPTEGAVITVRFRRQSAIYFVGFAVRRRICSVVGPERKAVLRQGAVNLTAVCIVTQGHCFTSIRDARRNRFQLETARCHCRRTQRRPGCWQEAKPIRPATKTAFLRKSVLEI